MKLLGIARVSTEEQAGDHGAGLNRQRDAIQRVAEANSAQLLEIVDIIDVSGSDVGTSKQWLTQVLPVIADPDVHIAVDALDRIIRASNFAAFGVLASCQSTGTRIYTPGGMSDLAKPDDVLVSGLMALIGGKEKSELVRRAQAGKEAKRQRGQWVHRLDALPRGIAYDRHRQSWSFTDEAGTVREMFRLAHDGASQAEIGRRVGLGCQTVRSMLQNPLYDGRLVFDERSTGRLANSKRRKKVARPPDQVIDVRVFSEAEQLVPHAQWLSVQARLRAAQQDHRRRRELTAPLAWASTFLFSAHEPRLDDGASPRHVIYGCGTGDGPGKPPRYLCRCKHASPGDELQRCGLVGLRCDVVNPALDRYLADLTRSDWLRSTALEAVKDAMTPDTTVLRERTARGLAALERREKKLLDLYEHDGIDLHEYTARRHIIKKERAELRSALAQAAAAPTLPSDSAIRAQAQAWVWDAAWPPEQKRQWLAQFVDAIYVSSHGIERAIFRVYGDDGSVMTCSAEMQASWKSLLGYAATGLERSAGALGAVPTGAAAERLGVSGDMLRWYLARGIVTFTGAKVGRMRLWTPADIDMVREQLPAHSARAVEHRRRRNRLGAPGLSAGPTLP